MTESGFHPQIQGRSPPRPPTGMTLAIGSMPHTDPRLAVELILDACPQAPCWPQLPALGFQENMMAQFSEVIPCVRVDRERKKVFIERSDSAPEELAAFYEKVFAAESAGDLSAFALSESSARGFTTFLRRFSSRAGPPPLFLKGQITGPLTFGLSVLDEQGLPALFDDTFSDVVRQAIRLQALWQIERLQSGPGAGILFVDEPVLAGFGSAAYINLSRVQAVDTLREIFNAVKATGFLVGSHCCANTDWSLMVEAGVDIINFDAFTYLDSLALYTASLTGFLRRGGLLAWGLVPTQGPENRSTPEELFRRLTAGIDMLVEHGFPRRELTRNLILTTSCGLGTLTEQGAEATLRELKELGRLVQERLTA